MVLSYFTAIEIVGGGERMHTVAGHLDGHGGATVQFRKHCLMKEVQGFHKSH